MFLETGAIIGIIHLVLVIWMVWDLLNSGRTACGIGCWIIVLICFPVVGPIIYLLFFRSTSER